MQKQNRLGFKKKAPYLQIKTNKASIDSKQPSSLFKRIYLPAEQTLSTEKQLQQTNQDKQQQMTTNITAMANIKWISFYPYHLADSPATHSVISTEQRRTALILAKTRKNYRAQRTGRQPLSSSLKLPINAINEIAISQVHTTAAWYHRHILCNTKPNQNLDIFHSNLSEVKSQSQNTLPIAHLRLPLTYSIV